MATWRLDTDRRPVECRPAARGVYQKRSLQGTGRVFEAKQAELALHVAGNMKVVPFKTAFSAAYMPEAPGWNENEFVFGVYNASNYI